MVARGENINNCMDMRWLLWLGGVLLVPGVAVLTAGLSAGAGATV